MRPREPGAEWDDWKEGATHRLFTLSYTEVLKRVEVEVMDGAGNSDPEDIDTIALDLAKGRPLRESERPGAEG